MWQHTPISLALGKQKDYDFKDSLDFIRTPCLKTHNKITKNNAHRKEMRDRVITA